MPLSPDQIDAMDRAETLMDERDFAPYLRLKALLAENTPQSRAEFRPLFTRYYGLNAGGLTEAFKTRFFEILFDGQVIAENGRPDYGPILNELRRIPRRNGSCAMPFSFVSKLAGIHREDSPIYDRHVLAFFQAQAPGSTTPAPERIAWYIDFLNQVETEYTTWATDPRLMPVLSRLRERAPGLARCTDIRLLDFLVWKIGNRKLL